MSGFPWWVLAGCLALGACVASLGWFILWDGAKLRAEEFCQQCYDEGYEDAVVENTQQVQPRPGHGPDPHGIGFVRGDLLHPGPASALARDWRAAMEQLAPAVLDAENLPGPMLPAPDGARARAGELHRRAVVDLGETGDDKMLTRDWFARRAFIESLYRSDVGGFEITEHGHLVAVAA